MITSCGYSGKDFQKDLFTFCQDGKVTPTEYAVLVSRLKTDGAVGGFSFTVGQDNVSIASEQDLIGYINSKGIFDSAPELAPVANVDFSKLIVYMESSASMKGYSAPNGNPYFTASVLALFNAASSASSVESLYVGAGTRDDVQYTQVSKSQYESQLTSGNVVIGSSSPLDKIIASIVESSTVEDVSCLITDGILSGSNAEIAANRDFTKTYLPLLEDRIRNAAKSANDKTLDFIIYRLVSSFNGTYYDYTNAKHQLSGVIRPYFVIVFGHKHNLEIFDSAIAKESGFKPTHRLASYNMGAAKTVTKGQIIKTPGSPSYNIKPVNSTLQFKQIPQIPVTFKYRINLNELPKYYRDVKVIKNNIKLSYRDVKTGIDVDKSDLIQDVELSDASLNNYDIVIEFGPDFLRLCPARLAMNLSFDGYIDDWYKVLSTDDDKNISNSLDQNTFALESLVSGLIKGIESMEMSKPIDCQINIEK